MTQTKKLSPLQTMAIFTLFLTSMGVAAVSPAMAKFAAQFPGYDYALISTMPTLTMVPTTLWAGTVAGKKIRYRTLSTVGILLFLIGGLTPFFLTDSFWVLIACRAVFGIGSGLRASLGNALIMHFYTGKKQANYLGYGTLLMNVGGIVFQMAGGALAEIQWNYTFLAYLFGLISLALVFFQPEPETDRNSSAGQKAETPAAADKAAGKLPAAVFIISGLFFLYNILNYPAMMNMSLLFESKNAGGASAAATALSLYTVGGCAVGFIFGRIFNRLARFTIPLGYFTAALGVFLLYIGSNALVMSIGATIMGMAFSLLSPAAYAIMGKYVSPARSAISISICMAFTSLGGFVSPYWLKVLTALFGECLYSCLRIQMTVFVLTGILFLFVKPFPKKAATD